MNSKQSKAFERLRKALDACHKSGLMGGVYDGSFYAWPVDSPKDPRDAKGAGFFDEITEAGGDSVTTKMNLDGGAGS